MPNIVNTHVQFHSINDEGKKKWNELCRRFKDWKEDEYVSQYPLSEIFGLPESDDGPGTYSWNVENMGSKWAFLQDPSDESFLIESAWSCPTDALQYICEEITAVDPDFIMTASAQDEMPNWIASYVFGGGELYDYHQREWEEIRDYMNEQYSELAEHYDEEEEDWDEDGRDIMYDVIWECCGDLMDSDLNYMLTEMKE